MKYRIIIKREEWQYLSEMLLHLTEGGEESGTRNFADEIETVVLYSDYINFLRQHVYLGRFKYRYS